MALTAFTAGSAYTKPHSDGGTFSVGRRADLAVLDHDLLELDGRLSDARVV